MAFTKPHVASIAIGAVGVVSAIGAIVKVGGDTAMCLSQTWPAEAPILTGVAAICAATVPFFAMLVRSSKEPPKEPPQ